MCRSTQRQRRGIAGARQRAAARREVPDELKGFISAAAWENELKTFHKAQLLRTVAQTLESDKAKEKMLVWGMRFSVSVFWERTIIRTLCICFFFG